MTALTECQFAMRTIIYLVNGTWPNGPPVLLPIIRFARWIRNRAVIRWFFGEPIPKPLWFGRQVSFPHRPLRHLDRDEHEYLIVPWDGDNSLSARMSAANKLRTRIVKV